MTMKLIVILFLILSTFITVKAYPSSRLFYSTTTYREDSIEFVKEEIVQQDFRLDQVGWVANLDIEKEAKAFDKRIKQQQKEVDDLFAKNNQKHVWSSFWTWLKLNLYWIFNFFFIEKFNLVEKDSFLFQKASTPLITTTYTDQIPRFVAYGDAWVNSNGFGIPHPSKLQGFTHYNIAFWISTQGAVDNVQAWTSANETVRKAIVNTYNTYGIRLGMAIFGETDRPASNKNDPIQLGNKIANFIQHYNLQGVDVDFEEYDLFSQKQATKWLIPLTRTLRQLLPANQFYLSHAPIAPLFNTQIYPLGYTWIEQDIGDLIDFYNVQFYNQDDYSTCQTLVVNSQQEQWPNTALLQLNQVYNIPLDKIVVGKPATEQDAGNGYISPQELGSCLAQYAIPQGWKAGCMWWEFKGDLQGILGPVRQLTGM